MNLLMRISINQRLPLTITVRKILCHPGVLRSMFSGLLVTTSKPVRAQNYPPTRRILYHIMMEVLNIFQIYPRKRGASPALLCLERFPLTSISTSTESSVLKHFSDYFGIKSFMGFPFQGFPSFPLPNAYKENSKPQSKLFLFLMFVVMEMLYRQTSSITLKLTNTIL